jgi:ceramide glucosyltransferase
VVSWFLAVAAGVLALAGAAQALYARAAFRKFLSRPSPSGPALPASVLKPLHGAEPRLAHCLAASLAQRHGAEWELLCAVARADDPARPVAEAAFAGAPNARVVVRPAILGENRKVSQLVHLAAEARHPVLVAVDSDMDCPPHWLTAVTAPLADPGVGLVTCLYLGVPADGSPWSRLAALGVNWHFLPNAALGETIGQADGCYGATMALRAETLARIGGFERLLDVLADDHALGEAVREAGLQVVVPPLLPGHVMGEESFAALWAHELRWARTTRILRPWSHVGLALTNPIPWALLALALAPGLAAVGVLGAAFAARAALARRVNLAAGERGWGFLAWLPIRDLLSFAVWATALYPGGVVWQGRRLLLRAGGRIVAAPAPGHPTTAKEAASR